MSDKSLADPPLTVEQGHPVRWLGWLLVMLAAAAAYLARDLPLQLHGRVGPGAFPLVLSLLLAACGLVLAIRPCSEVQVTNPSSMPWLTLAALTLFPVLLPITGSLISATVCATLVARMTSGSWLKGLAIGLLTVAGLHVLLIGALGTALPWWIP
jgi:putative tricarboxylic transport membrane protein